MYKVILSKQTAKTLNRMTPGARERVFRMLEKLQTRPFQGKRLHGELEALLSLRAGVWRIVYEINSEKHLVIIHGIGPRGDIYKK